MESNKEKKSSTELAYFLYPGKMTGNSFSILDEGES